MANKVKYADACLTRGAKTKGINDSTLFNRCETHVSAFDASLYIGIVDTPATMVVGFLYTGRCKVQSGRILVGGSALSSAGQA